MIRCFQRIKDHVEKNGLNIPFERLKEFAHLLDQQKADSLTNAEFLEKANALINDHLRRTAAKTRAANAMILAKRQAVMTKVMDTSSGTHVWENMRYWIGGGSIKPGWDTNRDPKVVARTIQADLLKLFNRGLDPIKEVVASGAIDREVYQEIWNIDQVQKPGTSGSKQAVEMAKVIQGLNNQIFTLQKAYNPFMERSTEYLVKRFHSREKVSETPKSEWVQDAMDAFGQRSFPELAVPEKEAMMESIYDRIVDGTYGYVTDDSESDKFITVKGPGGNIMKKMSRSRSLVATDADAAYQYNLKYGYGTIAETMNRVIRSASKDIALLEKFGPNPRGAYEGVYTRAYAKSSSVEKGLLKKNKPYLDRLFRNAIGETDVPAQNNWAKTAQALTNLEFASKGGTAIIRAQLDLASAASLMRGLNGKNVFQNAAEISAAYYKNMASVIANKGDTGALREAMEPLLLFSSGAQNALMDYLGGDTRQPGITAKIAEGVGKLSLMQAHVDALKTATGSVIANHLGKMADTPWANLDGRMQKGLGRYGIGEAEWNVIRQGVEPWDAMENGIPAERRKSLDASSIDSIPDENIAEYLTRSGKVQAEPSDEAIFLARKELTYKLGALINEHADLSVVHAGTQRRTFLNQGHDINDPLGMVLRLAGQFKAAAFIQYDNVKRGYYSGEGQSGDWAGTTQTIALLLLIGGMAVWAYDAVHGKTPESPMSADFVKRTLISSGAAGLYADTLFKAADKRRFGDMLEEVSKGMAGPVMSDAGFAGLSAIELGAGAAKGNPQMVKDAKKRIGDIGLGLVPGQNLFWSKAAFDFYVANGLKEFLNEGYLSRLEGHVNQTPGMLDARQKYFMTKPTQSPQWAKKLLGH